LRCAVSIGDLNGVSAEIALRAHERVKHIAKPVYFVDKEVLEHAAYIAKLTIPSDFECENIGGRLEIEPGCVTKEAGSYSFDSLTLALEAVESFNCDFLCTLPISKEAINLAGHAYKGHTDYFRKRFDKEAIMVLGCQEMAVALYTEHCMLRVVPPQIRKEKLAEFLIVLAGNIDIAPIGVAGLNPHGGEGGVLGSEDVEIKEAIEIANRHFGRTIFEGVLVPDTAFIPKNRARYKLFVSMYHDHGLSALKALYFEESINLTLNLPIVRVSVDHGCAFDIAYKGKDVSLKSYINAFIIGSRFKNDRTF